MDSIKKIAVLFIVFLAGYLLWGLVIPAPTVIPQDHNHQTRPRSRAEVSQESIGAAMAEMPMEAMPTLQFNEGPSPHRQIVAADDKHWQKFSQRSRSIVHLLDGGRAAKADPEQMFRHKDLNPNDKYIQPADRKMFQDFVKDYQEHVLMEALAIVTTKRGEEWEKLLANGTADSLELTDDPELVAEMARLGTKRPGGKTTFFDPRFYKGNPRMELIRHGPDGMFGLNESDFVDSAPYLEASNLLSQDFAAQIVNWFAQQGCLSPLEAQQLLEAIFLNGG